MIRFDHTLASRVPDRDYFDLMLASVELARRRIWVSLFICDVRPPRDMEGEVLDLVAALAERHSIGVDVRVLLTGSVGTPDIAVANLSTGVLLTQYGVPHRRVFGPDDRQGSHAKMVVCDQQAVVGSQNWTYDAFRLNFEDAVLVSGSAVDVLAGEFLSLWQRGKGMPRHAS